MKTTAKEAYELAAKAQEALTESAIRKAASEGRTSIKASWILNNQKLRNGLLESGYSVSIPECLISWEHIGREEYRFQITEYNGEIVWKVQCLSGGVVRSEYEFDEDEVNMIGVNLNSWTDKKKGAWDALWEEFKKQDDVGEDRKLTNGGGVTTDSQ